MLSYYIISYIIQIRMDDFCVFMVIFYILVPISCGKAKNVLYFNKKLNYLQHKAVTHPFGILRPVNDEKGSWFV